MERTKIGAAMQDALNAHFKQECFATIDFFQLRSGIETCFRAYFTHLLLCCVVDLPDPFENAIQLSEVKKQDIIKASAEKNRTVIELETLMLKAEYEKKITIVIHMQNPIIQG